MSKRTIVAHRSQILDNFICQKTGQCCILPGYVYVSSDDIQAMSKELNLSPTQFTKHFVVQKNGWSLIASPSFRTRCFLNDQHECQVYKARPHPCKTYPNWDAIWVDDDTLIAESKTCKGLALAIQPFRS